MIINQNESNGNLNLEEMNGSLIINNIDNKSIGQESISNEI